MPQKRASKPNAAIKTWWLQGEDECPHCGGVYVYETEFRCAECDGAGCRHCTAVHTEGHLVCVACHSASVDTQ